VKTSKGYECAQVVGEFGIQETVALINIIIRREKKGKEEGNNS